MRCEKCESENPETNKFCGNCGTRLEPAKVAVNEPVGANGRRVEPAVPVSYWEEVIPASEPEPQPEPERVVRRRSEPTRTSGSSFLGLTDAVDEESEHVHRHSEPTTISGPSFLGLTDSAESDESSYLLDDDQPRRRGGLLVFCLFAIAIFAAIGYVEWRTMQTGRLSIPFISKPASEQQAKTTPAPTPNSTEAAKTPATPQSDNTEANTDSLATSDNDNANNGPVNPVPGAAGTASDSNAKPLTSAAPAPAKTSDSSTSPETPHPSKTGSAGAAASDQQETESTQTRQAKEADQQRATDDASDSSDSEKPAPAKKAKPSARAASLEKAPDPRQNRMLLLGERYLYGHGVPQNCNQALVYFKGAAEENNAPAMAHLGAMYASGECVTQNRVTAFNWFARAQNAQPNDPWLQRNMNMLWRDMTPQERTAINK